MTQGPNYRHHRDPREARFQRQRLQSWAAHHPGHPLRHGFIVVLRQATLLLCFCVALYAIWTTHLLRL